MAFTISKARQDEFDSIARFLQEYFLKEVSLTTIFSLEADEPPAIPDVADFILKAEDSQGHLVGVAFNTSQPTLLWDKEKSHKQREVVEFLEFFEANAGLHVLSPKLVEVWLMGVHPQWRRRGVGRALVEASEREARAAGFSLISITGVSQYVARLAQSLGWRLHYSLTYSEYPRLSKTDVQLIPNPPHDMLSYYVKQL